MHGRDHGPYGMDPLSGWGVRWAHLSLNAATITADAASHEPGFASFRTNQPIQTNPAPAADHGFWTTDGVSSFNQANDTTLTVQGAGIVVHAYLSMSWNYELGDTATQSKMEATLNFGGSGSGYYAVLNDVTDFQIPASLDRVNYNRHIMVFHPVASNGDYGITSTFLNPLVYNFDSVNRSIQGGYLLVTKQPIDPVLHTRLYGSAYV